MKRDVYLMPSNLDDIVLFKHLGMPDEGYAVFVDEDEYSYVKEYRITFQIDIEGLDEDGNEVFSTRDGEAMGDIVVEASVVKEEIV